MADEDDYNPVPPRRTRLGVALLVVVVHVLAILGLVRALAPDFSAKAVKTVLSSFNVTITAPPTPKPSPEPARAGKAGDPGKKAVAREAAAPEPKVPIAKASAPKAASTGSANTSGAANQGVGTGLNGPGSGPRNGGDGSGPGGGRPTKAAHIAGQIDRASDFPVPLGGREARIGKAVILALTVSPSGRATACRVYRSSGFPDTDAVACRLAMERLRFRPATNAAGEPVTSIFYWQQKFFF
jgi:protein TonB